MIAWPITCVNHTGNTVPERKIYGLFKPLNLCTGVAWNKVPAPSVDNTCATGPSVLYF